MILPTLGSVKLTSFHIQIIISTLIPDEVNDEFGGIFPQGKLNLKSSWFSTIRFDTKEDAPKTWKWVQEEGIKIRHFKSPRCVKENSFLSC